MDHGLSPEHEFTFAVGGIYGQVGSLNRALAEIGARSAGGTVVFTGNYGSSADPYAGAVVQRLINGPAAGWRWICLLGSQESRLLESSTQPGDAGLTHEHLNWFSGLPKVHADLHRVYVHAALDEAFGLVEQPLETLIYGVARDADNGGYRGRHVVHAYTPTMNTDSSTSVERFGYGTAGVAVAMFDDSKPGAPVDVFTLESAVPVPSVPSQRQRIAELRRALQIEEAQLARLRSAIEGAELSAVQLAHGPQRVLSHQQAIFEYRQQLAGIELDWP